MSDRIAALHKLHTRLIDSREGYAECIDHVASPDLKATITDLHDRRARDADAVRTYLTGAGESIEDDGSLLAAGHRTFIDMKDLVAGSDDAPIVAEIVRGEKELLEAYDDAITAAGGNDPEFDFVVEHYDSLSETVNKLEARTGAAA